MILTKAQQQWIDDLRKYPERQITRELGYQSENGEIRCCVVGQGIITYAEVNGLPNRFKNTKSLNPYEGDDFWNVIKLGNPIGIHKLMEMNDSEGKSFAEIADYMEKNLDIIFK